MEHVLYILEVQHLSEHGETLWADRFVPNTFHTAGEEFLLRATFLGGRKDNSYIPAAYYLGLDNRSTVTKADIMETIQNSGTEPTGGGYRRATVPSLGQFQMIEQSGWAVLSPTVYFVAGGQDWKAVRNVFLTDRSDYGGYLIASVPLNSAVALKKGQSLSLKMGIKLTGKGTAAQTANESISTSTP